MVRFYHPLKIKLFWSRRQRFTFWYSRIGFNWYYLHERDGFCRVWMNELSRNARMEAEWSSNRPSYPSHHIVCVHHSAVVVLNRRICFILFFLSGHPSVCVIISSVCHVAETKHTCVCDCCDCSCARFSVHVFHPDKVNYKSTHCVITAVTKWWLPVGIRAFIYFQL